MTDETISQIERRIRERAALELRKRVDGNISVVRGYFSDYLNEKIYCDGRYWIQGESHEVRLQIGVGKLLEELRKKIIETETADAEKRAIAQFLADHDRMREVLVSLGKDGDGESNGDA